MPTLSFLEYLQIRNHEPATVPENLSPEDLFQERSQPLPLLAARFRKLLPTFRRYLLLGGFPETALADGLALGQRVLREDVIDKVLKRDVPALFGVRNVLDLEKLFVYLCKHSGGIFSSTDCANALGSSRPTVLSYLETLQAAKPTSSASPPTSSSTSSPRRNGCCGRKTAGNRCPTPNRSPSPPVDVTLILPDLST